MPTHLLMELTGESRATQVQPPGGAWRDFFMLDADDPKPIRLRNGDTGEDQERAVVRHDHNWTVEIPESACPRPAIIKFSRRGKNRYTFWIRHKGDPDYANWKAVLQSFSNPARTHGRLWQVLG